MYKSTFQDLTSDVGRLVGTVEEVSFFYFNASLKRHGTTVTQVLGKNRGEVVKIADRVEENVGFIKNPSVIFQFL